MSQTPKIVRKIITKFDPPPIPIRGFDWSAVRGGYDLGDCIGHGATAEEAIADLLMEEGMGE